MAIRVLLSKLGLDGHDRGVKVVGRALRDAGMEVIYTGLWQSPERVARAAAEEDVDVVGVSMLSGAHLAIVPRLVEAMRAEGIADVPVVVGGTVPADEAQELRAMGVAAVFEPGTPMARIVETVRELAMKGAGHA